MSSYSKTSLLISRIPVQPVPITVQCFMGLLQGSPTGRLNLVKLQVAKHLKQFQLQWEIARRPEDQPIRYVIYEARFCLEPLKEGGCGLDGTCPVAGIEPHHVSFLAVLYPQNGIQVPTTVLGTFSVLVLFPYIMLNFSQTRRFIILKTHCTF